jgi:hypothetical protein
MDGFRLPGYLQAQEFEVRLDAYHKAEMMVRLMPFMSIGLMASTLVRVVEDMVYQIYKG